MSRPQPVANARESKELDSQEQDAQPIKVIQPVADWWRPRHPRRGFRAKRHATPPRHPHQPRYALEPMEPRFLLNGELTSLFGSGAFGDMATDAAEGFLAFGNKLDDIISTLDGEFAGLPGMLTQRFEVDGDGNITDEEARPPKIADLLSQALERDPDSIDPDDPDDLGSIQGHGQDFSNTHPDVGSEYDYYVNLAKRADYLYGQADDFEWVGPDQSTVLATLDLDGDGLASWREAYEVLFVGSLLSVLDDFAGSVDGGVSESAMETATADTQDDLNERTGAIAAESTFFGLLDDVGFAGSSSFNDLLSLGSGGFTFAADDNAVPDFYTLGFSGNLAFGFDHTFDLDFGVIADSLGIQALGERFTSGNNLQPTTTPIQPEIDLTADLDIPLAFSFALPDVGDEVGDELTQGEYDAYYAGFGLRAGTFAGDGSDPIQMTLSSNQDLNNLFVNVGFLGLQATSESTFTLDIIQEIELTPASLPSTLGFDGNLPLESSDGVLTAESPIPSDLDYPVEFELSFTLDAWSDADDGPTTPMTVVVEPPEGGETLQDVVDSALVDSGLDELLAPTVVDIGGENHLQFTLHESNRAQLALTPTSTNVIEMTLEDSWFTGGDFGAAFLLGVGTNASQLHRVSASGNDREAFLTALNASLPPGVTAGAVTETQDDGEGGTIEFYTGKVTITGPVSNILYVVDEFSIEADGVVRLDELLTADAGDLFNLPAANEDSFAFDLSLEVIAGLDRTTGSWGTIEIAFGTADADDTGFGIFDLTGASLTTDINGFQRLDYSAEMGTDHRGLLEDGLTQEVVDFNQVGANSVVGMIGQLRAWADRVADSAYLGNMDIPFADLVLGEVLGFDALVQETLLFDEIGEEAGDTLSEISRLIAQVEIDGNVEALVPFTNVQELAKRLDTLGLLDATDYDGDDTDNTVIWYDPVDIAAHDPNNPKLLLPLTLSRLDSRLSTAESPVDFLQRLEGGSESLLGPLELTFSASTIEVGVLESMNVTLGILLGEGGNLDGNPGLDDLGVTPMDDLAVTVTGGEEVQTVYGRLSADATFQIRLDGGDWETITVTQVATSDNTTAEDLASDINAQLTGGLNVITAEVLNGRIVLVADDTVPSFDVDVTQTNTAFKEIGLASSRASNVSLALATQADYELDSEGDITITVHGDTSETIGLSLPAADTTGNRTLNDLVNDLNALLDPSDGVIFTRSGNELILGSIAEGVHYLEVEFDSAFENLFDTSGSTSAETGLLLQAGGEIASQYGQISGDANTIVIGYNDTATVEISLTESETTELRSIAELVDLLNGKLADESVSEVEFVALGAKRLGIKALDDTVTEISITGAEPLGYSPGIDGDSIDASLRLSAAQAVTHYFGPDETASFDITYNDGSETTETITLESVDTLKARSLYDLERVLQDKLDTAFGSRLIDVGIDNGRLTFTAEDGSGLTGFSINNANSEAEEALGLKTISGLSNLTANTDDLLIRTHSGAAFTVDLTGIPDIAGTISAIQTAADTALGADKFIIEIADDNASLLVTDNTTPVGDNTFGIETLNGSRVARQLGIFSAGSEDRQADLADNVIRGNRIGVPTLSDRLSIEDDGRNLLEAEISLTLPDFSAEARLGFMGIGLMAGSDPITASFSMSLADPGDASGYTLRQLLDAVRGDDIGALGDFLDEPEIDVTAGDIEFDISLLAGTGDGFQGLVDDLGLVGDESIVVRLVDFGDIDSEAFVLPDIQIGHFVDGSFETFDTFEEALEGVLGDLGSFSALDFSTFGAALESLRDIIDGFSDIPFLSQEIPILGVSILGMVGIADDFAVGIEEILDNPVATIQELEGRLIEALGLPDGAIGMALDLVDGNQNLIFDIDFSRSFSEPINIQLDLAELAAEAGVSLPTEVTDNFGLYGAAGLAVSGAIDAKLSFGIDLTTLIDGDGDPVLDGDGNPAPTVNLLYGGDRTNLSGNLRATGDNLTFNAALGPLGASVRDGTALIEFEFDLLDPSASEQSLLLFDDSGPNDFLSTLEAAFSPELVGTVDATLPIYFPTSSSYLGDILLGADLSLNTNSLTLDGNLGGGSDVLAFSAGFFDALDFENFDIFSSLPLMVDGFDLFLSSLQSILQGQVMGIDIPFLGDALGDGATVIEDFRQDFVDPFRQQVEEAPQRGLEIVQDLLFRSLWSTTVLTKLDESGPAANVITDLDGRDLFDFSDIDIGDMGDHLDGLGSDINHYINAEMTADGVQWNFVLGGSWQPDVAFDFDLGFPALGLDFDVDPEIILDWSLGLGFGLNTTKGAYFDVGRVSYDIDGSGVVTTGTTIAEFDARAQLAFQESDTLTGRLGFLELVVTPNGPAFVGGELVGTGAFADFQVDLVNTGGDDTLAFFELGQLDAEVTLEAGARLDVEGTVQFNDDIIPDGAIAPLLPSIQTDFVFDWGNTGSVNGLALPPLIDGSIASGLNFNLADSLNEIAFNNVQLNVGSFLTDLLGPIVGQIQEITGPLEPIIEVLTTPIPVISDLAGKPITLVDLAATFGEFDPGFIYAIADIIQLVNTIEGIGDGDVFITIGSFSVFEREGSSAVSGDQLAKDSFDISSAWGDDLSGISGFLDGFSDDFAGLLGDGGAEGTTKKLLTSGFGEGGGFDFPILSDPAQIFGLLVGRPAVLVTYDMPTFAMDFEYQQSFPVYGPIFAVITVGLGMQIDLAFGYDTYGFQTFADGNFENPLDLLGGFYISDRENPDGSGADVPELILTGEVFAGAEVNLGIGSAGVEGGIILTVNFDLYDPDRDGRVRLNELLSVMEFEARTGSPLLAPIAIFDISGDIAAQLRAYIKILTSKFTIDITPPIVLFEFEIPFDREPILATESGSTLILNIGDYSQHRLEGDKRDIGEEIFVEQTGTDSVKIWSDQFGVPEKAAQTYSGISKILVRGGEGDDIIDLSRVSTINAEIHGGEGNDTIYLGGGNDLVYGGLGNDVIDATTNSGGGDNIIYGGRGDDRIFGGGGDDLIFGGSASITDITKDDDVDAIRLKINASASRNDGNNYIETGNGNNLVFGGGGDDIIIGGDAADIIFADGGLVEVVKNSPWNVISTQYIDLGIGGNDRVFGGDGDDEIFGGPGDDILKGGEGDDTIYGNKGFDILFGDGSAFGINDALADDPDFEFDGDTLEAIQWAFVDGYEHGDNTLDGGTEDDLIFGGFGNSTINGGRGGDTIFGDGGRVDYTDKGIAIRIQSLTGDESGENTLVGGGEGGNIIFGGAGVDTIQGGGGPDLIFGGAGNDNIDGGDGPDVIFGDTGLVAYRNFGGDGVHRMIGDDDLPDDIKTIFNDSENNTFDLNPATVDLILALPNDINGDDTIVGGAGDDIIIGGGGDDHLYGDWEVDPGNLPATAPQGSDIVVGDWARLDFNSRRITAIESLFAGDGEGGADTLYGNGGNDVLIGGSGGDTIHGVNGGTPSGDGYSPIQINVITGFNDNGGPQFEVATGDDILVGDNARLIFDPAVGLHPDGAALVTFGGYLTRVETTDTKNATGGVDTLYGDLGSNILIGGAEGDSIYGANGDDIILGDNGVVTFGTQSVDDKTFVYLDRVESVVTEDDDTDGFVGGADTILGFNGDDIILGGIDGDTIDGNEGDDILLGDNGLVELISSWYVNTDAPGARLFLSGVVERIVTTDTENASGGVDTIRGGEGNDILLGGAQGDFLYGSLDIPLTGDQIVGDNLILGDNGELVFDTSNPDWVYLSMVRSLLGGTDQDGVVLARPTDANDYVGGEDHIYAGDGDDMVIGGLAGDEIHGQAGNDVLLGDNGQIDFVSGQWAWNQLDEVGGALPNRGGLVERIVTSDIANDSGGDDVIYGGEGSEIILGGAGGDVIYGNLRSSDLEGDVDPDTVELADDDVGDNLILGDNGEINFRVDADANWVSLERVRSLLGGTDQDGAVLPRPTDVNDYVGGEDLIYAGDGDDIVIGGLMGDEIHGQGGDDVLLGDNGQIDFVTGQWAWDQLNEIGGTQDPVGGALPNRGGLVERIVTSDITNASGGDDVIYGGEGSEIILGGAGGDVIYGNLRSSDLEGDVDPDTVGLADDDVGDNLILGDNGEINFRVDADATWVSLERVRSLLGGTEQDGTVRNRPDDLNNFDVVGGADQIYAGDGNDMVIGGLMGDEIHGQAGDDVLLGDNGQIDFVTGQWAWNQLDEIGGALPNRGGLVERIVTSDIANDSGGDDVIYGGEGSDIILGGAGGDVIYGNLRSSDLEGDVDPDTVELADDDVGDNLILGDNGEINFCVDANAVWVSLERVRSLLGGTEQNGDVLDRPDEWPEDPDSLVLVGGKDLIYAGDGDDMVIGGLEGDVIHGQDGDDIVLGDNGQIEFATGQWAWDQLNEIGGTQDPVGGALPNRGGLVERIVTSDITNASGGDDVIYGGEGSEIILGGTNNDTIYGNLRSTDLDGVSDPDSVALDPEDVGDNLILGDNGEINFRVDADANWVSLERVRSLLGGTDQDGINPNVRPADDDDYVGGADLIYAGDGDDIVVGGLAGDEIHGQGGDDVLVGDNGQLLLLSAQSLSGEVMFLGGVATLLETTDVDPADGGQDLILGREGDDIILGGVEGDLLFGEEGDDIILGDQGRLVWGYLGHGKVIAQSLHDAWGVDPESETDPHILWIEGYLAEVAELDAESLFGAAVHLSLDLVTTKTPNLGGRDLIDGGEGDDVMFGGTDSDIMFGGTDDDLMFGDHGRLYPQLTTYRNEVGKGHSQNFFAIDTGADDGGAGDLMFGGVGHDIMLGQQGSDVMYGGDGDDDMIGGHNVEGGIDELAGDTAAFEMLVGDLGEDARVRNDVFNDLVDGGSGSDVILGDNGEIWRHIETTSERHYQVVGGEIYAMPAAGSEPDTDSGYPDLNLGTQGDDPNWLKFGRTITLLDHDHPTQDAGGDEYGNRTFGDDLMAGGAHGDMLFGGLGDDVIQGDGSIEILGGFELGTLLDQWDLVLTGWQKELGGSITGLETANIDPLRDVNIDGDDGPHAFKLQVDDKGLSNEEPGDNPILSLRFNVIERATDGDDYIEGNGGSDLIYGGLGQDDIIGGSSSLFGLVEEDQRPDSGDEIYGGAGQRLERNEFVGTDDDLINWQDRHGRDADVIMGDNANIYRLVGGDNQPLTFNFDTSRDLNAGEFFQARQFAHDTDPADIAAAWYDQAWILIQPRAFELLDYKAGEGDTNGGGNSGDDLIHGESGDDLIHGMAGHDAIFGGSEDEWITGGTGNDWISGGTGDDGILGDDGLILPSRNGQSEALFGLVEAVTELDKVISTPGNIQLAVINQSHELKMAVRLFAFPGESGDFLETQGNDIIFGGLGNDWLHGGAGDDAISGAEALPGYYDGSLNWLLESQQEFWKQVDAEGNPIGPLDPAIIPWYSDRAPINPGDILQYEGRRPGTGEFALYDEHDPWRRTMLGSDGEWLKNAEWVNESDALALSDVNAQILPLLISREADGGVLEYLVGLNSEDQRVAMFDFLLNFDPAEGPIDTRFDGDRATATDGDDRIFGDLGNDWLVGGTGRDHMYGGRGDDMLNMDDDHGSNFGDVSGKNSHPKFDGDNPLANNLPDTYQSYADIVYGGAGRDRLILNTGADRAIDWVGEFNSYVVPFSPFGAFHISRSLQPQLQEFLYALAASDGADQWAPDHERHAEDQGNDRRIADLDGARNYEPYGELGLVLQKDADWQEQTGAPDDPQPGNFQGKRDVMRRELFLGDDAQLTSAFSVESGDWTMGGGLYSTSAVASGGAVSILHMQDQLPNYLEILVDASTERPKGGIKANAYILFDYQDSDDFKFAGIDVSTNKLVIGQRIGEEWRVLSETNLQMRGGQTYELGLILNGNMATLVVDSRHEIRHAFGTDLLSDGYLALGSDNAVSSFANYQVQSLPPLTTYEEIWGFDGATHGLQDIVGHWQLQDGVLTGAATGQPAMLFGSLPLGVAPHAALELEARLTAEGRSGFVYDYHGDGDYKFALLDADAGRLLLGYMTAKGTQISATLDVTLLGGSAYDLKLTLNGGQVLVTLKAADVLGEPTIQLAHVYYSQLNAGDWGLMVDSDSGVEFEHFMVRTNDVAYLQAEEALTAARPALGNIETAAVPTLEDLDALMAEAWQRLKAEHGDHLPEAMPKIDLEVVDLGGLRLAQVVQGRILIDAQAAGHGWFIDATPEEDGEFTDTGDGRLMAYQQDDAHGRIDLLTVLMHELGHLAGLTHADGALMAESLEPGLRLLPTMPETGAGGEVDTPVNSPAEPSRDQGNGKGLALGRDLLLFDLRSGVLRGDNGMANTPPVEAPARIVAERAAIAASTQASDVLLAGDISQGHEEEMTFDTVGNSALSRPLSLLGKFGSGLR